MTDERSVWDQLSELSGWTISGPRGKDVNYRIDVHERLAGDLPGFFLGRTPEIAAENALSGCRNAETVYEFRLAHSRCEGLLETLTVAHYRLTREIGEHLVDVRASLKILRDAYEHQLAEMGHPVTKPEPVNANVQKSDHGIVSS